MGPEDLIHTTEPIRHLPHGFLCSEFWARVFIPLSSLSKNLLPLLLSFIFLSCQQFSCHRHWTVSVLHKPKSEESFRALNFKTLEDYGKKNFQKNNVIYFLKQKQKRTLKNATVVKRQKSYLIHFPWLVLIRKTSMASINYLFFCQSGSSQSIIPTCDCSQSHQSIRYNQHPNRQCSPETLSCHPRWRFTCHLCLQMRRNCVSIVVFNTQGDT